MESLKRLISQSAARRVVSCSRRFFSFSFSSSPRRSSRSLALAAPDRGASLRAAGQKRHRRGLEAPVAPGVDTRRAGRVVPCRSLSFRRRGGARERLRRSRRRARGRPPRVFARLARHRPPPPGPPPARDPHGRRPAARARVVLGRDQSGAPLPPRARRHWRRPVGPQRPHHRLRIAAPSALGRARADRRAAAAPRP